MSKAKYSPCTLAQINRESAKFNSFRLVLDDVFSPFSMNLSFDRIRAVYGGNDFISLGNADHGAIIKHIKHITRKTDSEAVIYILTCNDLTAWGEGSETISEQKIRIECIFSERD